MRRALAVSLAALALAGSAFAYWSATGSASGSGQSLSGPVPVTVAAAAAPATLIPTGAATGEVRATITNPNAFEVRIRQLELDGFSANATGCALSFTTQDNGGSGWTVPAGGSISVALPGSLTMGTTAANGCQGETFTVYLKAT